MHIQPLARRLCLPHERRLRDGVKTVIPQGREYRTKEERTGFDAGAPVLEKNESPSDAPLNSRFVTVDA